MQFVLILYRKEFEWILRNKDMSGSISMLFGEDVYLYCSRSFEVVEQTTWQEPMKLRYRRV